MLGGIFGALLSHPFDSIKTCMQGDLERKLYRGSIETARKLYGVQFHPESILTGTGHRMLQNFLDRASAVATG